MAPLLTGCATVSVWKIATAKQKAFCVLQFPRRESVVTVQREFRRRYGIDPPDAQSIHRWHRQFEETGCLCKGKSTGRPHVSENNVQRIRECFQRSPRKSTSRASWELRIPQTTVWRVLRRRLIMKPYRMNNFLLTLYFQAQRQRRRCEILCCMGPGVNTALQNYTYDIYHSLHQTHQS